MFILACIPAFNEEGSIEKLVKETLSSVNGVVVCDDGSTDNTAVIAENSGAYVIKHGLNKGKGAALKSLFKYARHSRADVIVTIDGDGQFLPNEIGKLCEPIIEEKTDIVIGNRSENKTEMPQYRKVGNKILDQLSSMSSDVSLSDTQSGFRAYSKKAIQKITFTNDGFGADSEILINASKHGLKISDRKITVLYNTGKKTSTKNPASHATGVASSLIELILLRHPLRYLGVPGFIFLIIGIVASLIVISVFNETRYFSVPFTLISFAFLITGVLMILVSGILFSVSKINKNF